MLSLAVRTELTEKNVTVKVTMLNASDKPLRIVGSVVYDSDGSFLFQDPAISLSSMISTRKDGKIACSVRPSKVVMCSQGTIIMPLGQISGTASIPKLTSDESGLLSIKMTYMDSTLSTGRVEAWGMIPDKEETKEGVGVVILEK